MTTSLIGIGGKSGQAKLEDVKLLLETLRVDLKDKTLEDAQRDQLLEKLKIYGRDADNADPIFTKEGIETLAQYAFESTTTSTSREALRCLANALLLKEGTRQLFVNAGAAPKAAEKLKSDSCDDEFLLSRILFLLTYGTNANFEDLVSKNSLGESINQCLCRHAKRYSKTRRLSSQSSPMDDMALTETAKLLFNITHFNSDLSGIFSPSVPFLLTILSGKKQQSLYLDQSLSAVVNAPINLDLGDETAKAALFPRGDPKSLSQDIVNILDTAIRSHTKGELDPIIAPVISLLRKIYAVAPEEVKRHMESLLLPSDAERNKPLGKSDTLPSRLLKLSTSATTTTLRTSISSLLFELSSKNPTKFVANVGYGFAAGFLMSQNLPVPQNIGEATSAEEESGGGVAVNPITGQRLEMEVDPEDGLPPMTEEEKEEEAERLFVLFERLRATGVVDVVNPITRRPREEGDGDRIEELPD
ncbi:hypothetical protein EJ08DRAFT_451744 [Tothia fuscella]|uniref:Guanine nucleotide exchange factor n=1 Tax=Tothia fuscella TaxID=1048955 RepID=A0A9P4TV55_9PEZI|nr:hypothetical protein EJ08DRAFT_451744 [Tothia fuscella]